MKKILTLLLLATLLLTACNTPAPPIDSETTETTETPTDAESTTPVENETTTVPDDTDTTVPDDTDTTVPDEEITTLPPTKVQQIEEMLKPYGYTSIEDYTLNRKPPIIPVTGSAEDLRIGMSQYEVDDIFFPVIFSITEPRTIKSGKPFVRFWIDKDHNYVITVFDENRVLSDIKVFQELPTPPPPAELPQVEIGTHLFDVIELVGFPWVSTKVERSGYGVVFSYRFDLETLLITEIID